VKKNIFRTDIVIPFRVCDAELIERFTQRSSELYDRTSSWRRTSALPTERLFDIGDRCLLTAAAVGKTLSYIARASRTRRFRSSSDFGTNLTTSPMRRSNDLISSLDDDHTSISKWGSGRGVKSLQAVTKQ
jgi:hypothetical protein